MPLVWIKGKAYSTEAEVEEYVEQLEIELDKLREYKKKQEILDEHNHKMLQQIVKENID